MFNWVNHLTTWVHTSAHAISKVNGLSADSSGAQGRHYSSAHLDWFVQLRSGVLGLFPVIQKNSEE